MMGIILLVGLIFFTDLSSCFIDRPNIGVLTQPTWCSSGIEVDQDHFSYINSDYVKWLEMAGARVIPIMFDWKEDKMRFFFERMNGILFPGGDCPQDYGSPFMDALKLFYDWSVNETEYFPIWGTCQGFQSLFILQAETDDVLDLNVSGNLIDLPLNFNSNVSSRIFQNISQKVLDILETEKVTFNWHSWGITPEMVSSTPSLNDFYDIVTTNTDTNGRKFVSTVEAKEYPVYGAQWHAEMAIFADLPPEICHSYDAILANRVTNTFFVEECRKSRHAFKEGEYADDYTIENFTPVFTGKRGNNSIRQTFYFPNQSISAPPKNNTSTTSEGLEYQYIIVGLSSAVCGICCMCTVIILVCCFDKGIKCVRRNMKNKEYVDRQHHQDDDDDGVFFSEEVDLLHPYYSEDQEQESLITSTTTTTTATTTTMVEGVDDSSSPQQVRTDQTRQIVSSDGLKNQSGVSYQTDTIVNSLFE